MREHRLRHNGRTLAFSEQGPHDGYPVFYMHGTPGSRREPLHPSDRLFGERGLRIIALDRPGFGDSSPCSDYSFAAHAEDVAAVANHLGLKRFALFGFSVGGVFALACAHSLGSRVQRVVAAGTPAPHLLSDPLAATSELTGSAWQQARNNPEKLAASLNALTADAATLTSTMLDNMAHADWILFSIADTFRHYRDILATAVVQGPEPASAAIARDCALVIHPWPFDPALLRQPVHIFHGDNDGLLSDLHGRALAATIPDSTLEIGPECGHYSALYGDVAIDLWRTATEG